MILLTYATSNDLHATIIHLKKCSEGSHSWGLTLSYFVSCIKSHLEAGEAYSEFLFRQNFDSCPVLLQWEDSLNLSPGLISLALICQWDYHIYLVYKHVTEIRIVPFASHRS